MSASDVNGDTLTYTAPLSGDLPAGASFTDLGNGLGEFSWDPATPIGVYPVTFTVSDGTLSDTETIDVEVLTEPPPSDTPAVTTPVPGSVLSGSSETFAWSTNGVAVNRWQILVGSSLGGSDILVRAFNSSELSFNVTGLPTDGRTIYFRLRGRLSGGTIVSADYQYTAANLSP